jgi:hypothetical protein
MATGDVVLERKRKAKKRADGEGSLHYSVANGLWIGRPIACYFVHGERRTKVGCEVRLGKAWMVSRLQALAQTGRLHLPQSAGAEAARKELLDYEIRVSDDGHDSFGAFKTGRHDDLVTAIGLAVQLPLCAGAWSEHPGRGPGDARRSARSWSLLTCAWMPVPCHHLATDARPRWLVMSLPLSRFGRLRLSRVTGWQITRVWPTYV